MLDPAGFVCVISTFFVYLSCSNYMSFFLKLNVFAQFNYIVLGIWKFRPSLLFVPIYRDQVKVWLELLLGMNMWQDWELRCSHLSPSWDENGGVELGVGGALGWALRGGGLEVLVATAVLREGPRLVTQSPYLPHCHMCGVGSERMLVHAQEIGYRLPMECLTMNI